MFRDALKLPLHMNVDLSVKQDKIIGTPMEFYQKKKNIDTSGKGEKDT